MIKFTYSQSQNFIGDLVKMSLNNSSTSVAIRINDNDRKIQIIDNGDGMSYQELEKIGTKMGNNDVFSQIHQLPTVIIMTKPKKSQFSYGKVFKFGHMLKVKKILDRPVHGTTVIIYFNSSMFKEFLGRQSIVEIIEDYTLDYPQVSFTVRDDTQQKINIGIKRKYCNQLQSNPIVKQSKHSAVNLFDLELDENNFKYNINEIINVLFSKKEKKNENNGININKTITPSSVDDHLKVQNDNIKCNEIGTPLSIISGEWSDWNSPLQRLDNNNNYNKKRYYSFLPEKLNKVLKKTEKRLFTRQSGNQSVMKGSLNFDSCDQKNFYDIRICKRQKKSSEITIEKNSLKYVKVLRQVNFEYIAGVIEQNNEKILILIDQHAMDERIRYENLLEDYRIGKQFISVNLKRPIKVNNFPKYYCDLLLNKRENLKTLGLNLIDSNYYDNKDYNNDYFSLIITAVPKCFLFKKIYNEADVIELTAKLLIEVAEKFINKIGINTLPSTIHNVIASEACHGAIKFGDPLNIKQCNDLLNYWKQTDLPNRCAHGRPVITPLLKFNK